MPIFHRKSRWQRLLENLDSVSKNLDSASKKPAIKAGATATVGVAALSAASAAISSYRRKTNA